MQQVLDGIDVQRLQETITTLQNQPEMAQFTFRARNRWVNGTHNQAIVQDFYGAGQEDQSREIPMVFEEDEPPVLFGQNVGANPVEYILVGLSGCLTTALVAHAAARGIELKSVESHLEGDLDARGFLGIADVRNGYESIRIRFILDADAPESVLQELIQVAQERSPVFDIVTNKVPVSVGMSKKKQS